jgi:hypothetical protein
MLTPLLTPMLTDVDECSRLLTVSGWGGSAGAAARIIAAAGNVAPRMEKPIEAYKSRELPREKPTNAYPATGKKPRKAYKSLQKPTL